MTFRDTGSFNLRSAIPGVVESLSPKWTLIHDAVNITNGVTNQSFDFSGYKEYIITINNVKHQWDTSASSITATLQTRIGMNGSYTYTYSFSVINEFVATGIFLGGTSGGAYNNIVGSGISPSLVAATASGGNVPNMSALVGMNTHIYFTTNNNGLHSWSSTSQSDYSITDGTVILNSTGTAKITSTTPTGLRISTGTTGNMAFLSGVVSIWGK